MLIIVLISLFVGNGCDGISKHPIREYNSLKIYDDAHFYPSAGLYLEPAGQYLSYSGSITIPFVYVLPSVEVTKHYACKEFLEIPDIHLSVLHHIKEMLVPYSKRSPRSLIPFISLFTGGLSVWNTVEIQNVKSKISLMEQNQDTIDRAIRKLVNSQNIAIGRLGEITALLGEHARTLNRLINETECNALKTTVFQHYISSWLYSAPSEFISAYGGAVTGKLTPDLLSAYNLKKILLDHIEMSNTIYKTEPASVYEFGQVLLTEVYAEDHAYLKGLIQLPKILAVAPMPIYNVYAVNVLHNGIDYKYDVPGLVACSTLENCWKADSEKCIKKQNRVICLYGTDTTPNPCLLSLRNNSTKDCKITTRQHTSPLVIQTRTGILVGGSLKSYKIFKRIGSIDTPSGLANARGEAMLITSSSGDWVTISDNIYSTAISGFSYNFTIYITPSISNNTIDRLKLGMEWKPIHMVTYDGLKFSNVTTSDSFYIVILLIDFCLIIAVVYLATVIHMKHKPKPRSNYMQTEFIGLR